MYFKQDPLRVDHGCNRMMGIIRVHDIIVFFYIYFKFCVIRKEMLCVFVCLVGIFKGKNGEI